MSLSSLGLRKHFNRVAFIDKLVEDIFVSHKGRCHRQWQKFRYFQPRKGIGTVVRPEPLRLDTTPPLNVRSGFNHSRLQRCSGVGIAGPGVESN